MISNQHCYNTLPQTMLQYDGIVRPSMSRKRSLSGFDNAQFTTCEPASFNKKRKVAQKKSVSFSESNQVFTLPSSSGQQQVPTWYLPVEIAGFKQDSKRAVLELYVAQGDFSKVSKDHCIRGLEHVVTPTAAMAQRRARKERVAAVLIQQQLQRATNTCDLELLRLVSLMCSQTRCDEAAHRGAQDARVWHELFF